MRFLLVFCGVVLCMSVATAHATFYQCKVDGRTIISNVPCAGTRIDTSDVQAVPPAPEPEPAAQSTQKPATPGYRTPVQQPAPAPIVIRVPAKKEYALTHRVTEKNKMVEVSGRATGPQCNSLRIQVFARSDEGNIIECVDVTKLSGNSTTFSCRDHYPWRSSDRMPREWFVSSIYANCQD